MGRVPTIAAPTDAPMMDASEMGVSQIRSGPNSSTSPAYWPKTPPRPRSSPSAQTSGSRRISSAMASRAASAYVRSLVTWMLPFPGFAFPVRTSHGVSPGFAFPRPLHSRR